ncbi:MAG TPA: DUF6588 family protein [Daejeonella sp.]|nr:DUF6588 family protein [Daejeonella sp.]
MKKTFTQLSLALVFLFFSASAFAQGDLAALIKSGPADATKLAQAYMQPIFKGFGVGLNAGWNNTAQAKKTGRFEIRFGLTGAFIPQKDQMFDVNQLGLSNHIGLAQNQSPLSPTVAGKDNDGPLLNIYDRDKNDPQKQIIESFNLPQGLNLPFVPAPQLQASVGLPRGIDLNIRAVPTIKLGGDFGTIDMLGGGLKVDVLKLLAGKTVKKVSPLDVAVAVGYTSFSYKLPMDVKPESGAMPVNGQQSRDFSNQKLETKFSGLNTELIVSKKLLFFTPFISAGYNHANTKANLKGNYPMNTGAILGQKFYTTFSNPVSIDQKYISGMRTDVGFRLSMGFLKMYSSYSMSDYNSFNFGLGLGL